MISHQAKYKNVVFNIRELNPKHGSCRYVNKKMAIEKESVIYTLAPNQSLIFLKSNKSAYIYRGNSWDGKYSGREAIA